MKFKVQAKQDVVNKQVVNRALCVRFDRADGEVFSFTTFNKKLTVSSIVYTPVNGASDTDLEQRSDMSVNNVDLITLTSSAITEAALIGGKFDNSTVTLFEVLDSADLSKGIAPLLRGRIGEVETRGSDFRAEVRGNAQALQQGIVDLTSITCRAELGDAQCKVQLAPAFWSSSVAASVVVAGDAGLGSIVKPITYNGLWAEATQAGTTSTGEPTWPTTVGGTVADGTVTWRMFAAFVKEGAVTGVFDQGSFQDTSITDDTGRFKYGKVTWVSTLDGGNNGLEMEVREHQGGGFFRLWEPMAFPVNTGDTYTVQVGCAKRFTEDCKTKFNNHLNFDGEPFLPGEHAATEFPDAR